MVDEKFAAEFGDPLVLQRKNATPDMPGPGCMAKLIFYNLSLYVNKIIKDLRLEE